MSSSREAEALGVPITATWQDTLSALSHQGSTERTAVCRAAHSHEVVRQTTRNEFQPPPGYEFQPPSRLRFTKLRLVCLATLAKKDKKLSVSHDIPVPHSFRNALVFRDQLGGMCLAFAALWFRVYLRDDDSHSLSPRHLVGSQGSYGIHVWRPL